VPAVVKAVQPHVLVSNKPRQKRCSPLTHGTQFTASMWSPEQSQIIRDRAKEIVPGLKTYALPQGLQVDKGPDAVVEHILEKLPSIIEG